MMLILSTILLLLSVNKWYGLPIAYSIIGTQHNAHNFLLSQIRTKQTTLQVQMSAEA